MIPMKYQSCSTALSIDKDLTLITLTIANDKATIDDFCCISARFLISNNVDIMYHFMLTNLTKDTKDTKDAKDATEQKTKINDMRAYFDSIDLPTNHNSQRDRNNWAQMTGVYFMYIRTRQSPSMLVFSPEVLTVILKVNTYYIDNFSYFDDVDDIIIHRTKANLELC